MDGQRRHREALQLRIRPVTTSTAGRHRSCTDAMHVCLASLGFLPFGEVVGREVLIGACLEWDAFWRRRRRGSEVWRLEVRGQGLVVEFFQEEKKHDAFDVENDRWLDSLFANRFALYQCSMRTLNSSASTWQLVGVLGDWLLGLNATSKHHARAQSAIIISIFPLTIFTLLFYT